MGCSRGELSPIFPIVSWQTLRLPAPNATVTIVTAFLLGHPLTHRIHTHMKTNHKTQPFMEIKKQSHGWYSLKNKITYQKTHTLTTYTTEHVPPLKDMIWWYEQKQNINKNHRNPLVEFSPTEPRNQDVSTLHDYVTTLLWGLDCTSLGTLVMHGGSVGSWGQTKQQLPNLPNSNLRLRFGW